MILLIFIEFLSIVLMDVIGILMMSANLATSGLLKKVYFENKAMTSQFLAKMSPTKFYHVTQRFCGHSLVTLAFL